MNVSQAVCWKDEPGVGVLLLYGETALVTPRKSPLVLPNESLARLIAAEWGSAKKFDTKRMPMTALAYSAIDIIPSHIERMVEALLAYGETDLLCYRSETPALLERQQEVWDPVIQWVNRRYECHIAVTHGIVPVSQSAEFVARLRSVLVSFGAFEMAAFSVLVQAFGSLLLALSVREGEVSAERAFELSRVDEAYQAEQWGEDSIAVARTQELKREVLAAAEFLKLAAVSKI